MSDKNEKGTSQTSSWQSHIEFSTSLSADRRFIICKTIITSIEPVSYLEKVINGSQSSVKVDTGTKPKDGSEVES